MHAKAKEAKATSNEFPLRTLDQAALAEVFKQSKKTIQNKVCIAPETLPPFIRVGTKVLWLEHVVVAWLEAKMQHAMAVPPPPRRRGRPTKIDELRRKQIAVERAAGLSAGG